MGSREGWGRHRQPWFDIVCPACSTVALARRARPPALHIKAHLNADGDWCACVEVTAYRFIG